MDALACLMRAFGGLAHGDAEFVKGGRGFLKACRLALGALGKLVGGAADLFLADGNIAALDRDLGHGGLEMAERIVEVVAQGGVFLAEIGAADREIAAGDLLQRLADGGDHMGLHRRFVTLHALIVFALVVERHLLGGFALGHGVALADLFLKRLGRLGHHAHLVVHVGVGNGDRDVFFGDSLQGGVDARQRAGDAANHVEGGGGAQEQHDEAARQRLDDI